MTGPTPLPIDVSGIDEQLPDIGHEAIRVAALNAIQTVWVNHQGLVTQLGVARGDLTATQQDVTALQATVAEQARALTDLHATVADLQAQVAALTPPAP